MKKPSIDMWLEEAGRDPAYEKCGMFLFHNGTVRATPKKIVRPDSVEEPEEDRNLKPSEFSDVNHKTVNHKTIHGKESEVCCMKFSYSQDKVKLALSRAESLPGIYFVRAWLNEGILNVGDDIMLVMIGGDIRPRVIEALESLVDELKNHCVVEEEIYR